MRREDVNAAAPAVSVLQKRKGAVKNWTELVDFHA